MYSLINKGDSDMGIEIGGLFLLKLFKIKAITIGCLILYANSVEMTPYNVRRHEIKHTEQMLEEGIYSFISNYAQEYVINIIEGDSLFDAYYNISYEVEARSIERCYKCVKLK